MDISTLATPLSWARPIWIKINQNKFKFSIYLLVAYFSALLVSHLLGDTFDVTKLKHKGPASSRPTRQTAAQQQQAVDPFATRPRIETKNGHLILSASQDKNIDFKTSGGRGTITLNGFKLDQLFGVARALEKSTKLVGGGNLKANNTVSESDLNAQEHYELILKSLLGAVDKIKDLGEQQTKFTAKLDDQVQATKKVSKSGNKNKRQLRELQRDFDALLKRLRQNECLDARTGRSVCLNGAVCVDQFDSFKCLCPDQFEGERCELDVDECQRFRGTDLGCQNGAKCVNLAGGYKCECPPQFHGVHCTEQHNDCTLASSSAMCGHGKCVNLARSQANQASFECICDQGWTTDGKSAACLIDVNECLAGQTSLATNVSDESGGVQQMGVYPCSQNPFVECYNLPGSFQCGPCPSGYQGNGRVCRDIDECQRDNGGCSRSPLVECINLPGSRKCGPCPPGYQSNDDSITCSRASACQREPNGGCDPMAKCVELAGVANADAARLCVCQYPFVGQGVGPNGCSVLGLVPQSVSSVSVVDSFSLPVGPNSSSDSGQLGQEYYVPEYNRMMQSLSNATRVQIQLQDDCNPNPCFNGGQCLQGDGSFECVCTAKWTGLSCQQAVEFGCGGLLPLVSRGVFEFPLDGAYDKLLSDQKQQQQLASSSSNQTPSRTGPVAAAGDQPKQVQCVWQLAMPLGMAARMAFSNMKTSRAASRIQTFVNSAQSGNGTERPLTSSLLFEVAHKAAPPNCIERLDVREKLPPELQSPDDSQSGKLLGRFCVASISSSGANNKFNGSLQLESESRSIELEYTFAPRLGHTFEPSLAFQLQWTKIEPPCGGPLPPGDSGSVSSPHFPDFYQAGLECRYLLRVSAGKRIRIQVGELRLLHGPGSGCSDSLTILDGSISVDRPVLFQHCANKGDDSRAGSSVGQPIISSSSTVEVVLISKPNSRQPPPTPGRHKNGFFLTYESEPNEPNCSGLYTTKTGVIKSSDYVSSSTTATSGADLSGGGDDSALAYQFAHYFDLKDTLQPDNGKRSEFVRAIGTNSTTTSRKWKLRCEYEIRPADLARNHHVQLDWIEMPSMMPSQSLASLDRWLRTVRCRLSRLMIYHSKPVGEDGNRTSDKLLATFCSGDKYNSSLSELRPLISTGHVLYLVYEGFVPTDLDQYNSSWTSHGFRLSYKTICSATYQQLGGQIQTELERDVAECVYHLRLPANNSIRLVVERWRPPRDSLYMSGLLLEDQSKQQQGVEQSLLMPDGSCIVQTVIMDGAVPRGDLGLAQAERQLKSFEFSGSSPATSAELDTDSSPTDNSPDDAQAVPSTPGSRGLGDAQPDVGATGPNYWQYSSSQTHDIKEVNICWMSTLGIHTAWNELSLMFRLNPKWLEQRPTPELGEKLRQSKFVIKYQAESACGGVISEPSRGTINLVPAKSNSNEKPTRPMNSKQQRPLQPTPPGRPCSWILRNPNANKLIQLAFYKVPKDEIASRQSEWFKWLRNGETNLTESSESSKQKLARKKNANLAKTSGQFQSVANCSQAFQELIELYEPSAGRVRLICPSELLTSLYWTTLSDIVQVRLINASDSELGQNVTVWPGRKPLVGFSSIQLNYTMETHDEKSRVCGGLLLQSSGTIQTPQFPFNYPRHLDCVWILKTPSAGQQLRLNFTRFRLEQSNRCRFDYLEIRNGPTTSSPLMNRFCGNSLESRVLISQSSVVSLHFHSDPYITFQGFRLDFDAAQTGCGGVLTAASGQIDSPNYPFPHAYGADCEWLIEVSQSNRVSLRVADLDLSCSPSSSQSNSSSSSDYLEIFEPGDDLVDGRGKSLGRWCHLQQLVRSIGPSATFESTGNKLRVVYRSQPQDQGRGFRLTYKTNCTFEHEITGTSGVIESAGFPVAGANGHNQCQWLVRAPYGSNLSVSITHFTAGSDPIASLMAERLFGAFDDNKVLFQRTIANYSDESLCLRHAQSDWSSSLDSIRFWMAKVVDTPTVSVADRLEPMKADLLRKFQLAQYKSSNATNFYNASQSIYNFTLVRALCSQSYFDERPREWRTFELANGANVLLIDQLAPTSSFRIEWRSRSVCGGLMKMDSNLLTTDGIRFDERLNLTTRLASEPVECLWLLRLNSDRSLGLRDGMHMELELSADMRLPGQLDDARPIGSVSSSGSLSLAPSQQTSCNQSVLQLFDGPNLKSPLLYSNCATLSQHESLMASGSQVLVRYFSAGIAKSQPTRGGLAGRSFTLSGFFGPRSGCWQHKYNVKTPFRQLAGQQSSPNYPDLYEVKRYRCTYIVDSVFNLGRIRFFIDELDIPPELESDSSDDGATTGDDGGGFVGADKCKKSGNYLAFRDPATMSWPASSAHYCGRFDRSTGLGASAGDSLQRSVYISESHIAELEFQSKGNTRGRWKVSYDRLCGSLVSAANKADELSTPNYPQRPQWPKATSTSNGDLSEDVCIWRISPATWATSEGAGGESKLHFNLLNLIGTLEDEGDDFNYGQAIARTNKKTIKTSATSRPRDCLRVYEGYNISLRQSAFNLTKMDAEMEPRLKLCSRADLKFNSMHYTSQGSELTIVTSGQLIAKFLVHPFENHCGGDFVLASAEFASPNYPQPYRSDLDCHYFIASSPGSRVQLNFELFDVAADGSGDGNKCDLSTDYVEIRQISSRLRAEIKLRDLFDLRSDTNQSTRFDVVDYVSRRVGNANKNSTDVAADQSQARRKSLDRLLELAHFYNLFEEVGSEARISSQVPGLNSRLSISLEEFYTKSTLIGRYCGKQVPKLSADQLQDEILIRLRTSGRRPAEDSPPKRAKKQQPRGFMASYKLQFGGSIKLASTRDDSWGLISSPFFPERKRFNSTIVWSFEAPLNSRIEFELVSMSLGSIHSDCQDTLSIFDGLRPSGGSARLGRLCGHLSYKNLLERRMAPLWASALTGQVSPRKLPINSAFDPYVRANLLRRFRTSSNVATVVYENVQAPGKFLMRYKMVVADEKLAISKSANTTNSTTSQLELELLDQPVDLDEALEEQFQPMADGQDDEKQLDADEACSRLYKLTPERTTHPTGNSTLPETVQLMSPNWPQELQARDLECHWLLSSDENINIVLQIAPSRSGTLNSATGRSRFASSEHCFRTPRGRGQERNFVVIYDGASELAPIIARICLPAAPLQLESTGRQMLVRYVHEASSLGPKLSSAAANSADNLDENSNQDDSEQQLVGSGSSSLFRAQAHVGRCGGQYHVNYMAQIADRPARRRQLVSGGGVSNYENNLDCFYYVFASDTTRSLSITGYISEFNLAPKPSNANCTIGDYIEVRDLPISSQQFDYSPQAVQQGRSLGRFCAGKPLPDRLVSPGGAIVVHFHTDADETDKGFSLAINVVSGNEGAGCPQQPIKLTNTERYAKITSPYWPHGQTGPLKACRFSFAAPLGKALKMTFVQLNRQSSLASNGSLVCRDSLVYLDDQEAPSLRYSHRPLRELMAPISAAKLRQLVQTVPCTKNSNKLAASSSQTSEDSTNQSKPTSLVEMLTAETYKELLLQMVQADGTLKSQLMRIVTNSSDLLLEYSAESLSPGEGFVAVIRVDDRPESRVCGGEVSSKEGENLLESANFGKLMSESDAYIQCVWRLNYNSQSALNFDGLEASSFSSSFLLFSVLEIPPLVQNSSFMDTVYGSYGQSQWSEVCGLNRVLVTDGDSRIYRAVAACGFMTDSNPKWLMLNQLEQQNQVMVRTRNLQQLVYRRWKDEDSLGDGQLEGRTKLFRGLRAYFYETTCPTHQKTAGISIVVRSHAGLLQAPPTSYQPGICEWTFRLKVGHFELTFKHLNLRPPSKTPTNSSRSTAVVESKTESICFNSDDDRRSSSDYVELSLASDSDGAILARFCAQNQLEAQKQSLVINATTDLVVRFVAGVEQLADGKYNFANQDKSSSSTKAKLKPFGFEFEILRVKNSTISEFCRHGLRSGSIYSMIRNRERAALYMPFMMDTITTGFLYPKNSHCSLDLSIEDNYRFNFTFVSFFDMEPSLNCTNDYIGLYDLVQRNEVASKTTTTGRPKTAPGRNWNDKPNTFAKTTARPTSTTPSSGQETTTVKSKSSINVYEKMTLNLNNNLEAKLIGRWCGRDLPKGTFVSKSNKVRLVFHSNEHVEGKGFLLEWSAMPMNSQATDSDGDD